MLKSLTNIVFPKLCYTCSTILKDNEQYICTLCRGNLPVTNFHFDDAKMVKKVLYGRVSLENATALLYFEKHEMTQKLLHNLKYKGFEDIGVFLGNWLGAELKTIMPYQTIDMVIPVPLHKKKLRKRGYNQVAKFAQCIAQAIQADYIDNVLIKAKNTKTQVFKSRKMRSETHNVFEGQNVERISGQHILLVDDLITTGATIENCAKALFKAQDIKLSVATMAIAL